MEIKNKGLWIPDSIMILIEEKKISAQHAMVLSLIESFTSNGKGCFASNDYVAEKMGVSKERIKVVLRELETVGLLIRTHKDGKRYLTTVLDKIKLKKNRRKNTGVVSNTPKGCIQHPLGSNTTPTKGRIQPHTNKDTSKENLKNINLAQVLCEKANNLAEQLYDILEDKLSRRPNLLTWSKSFRELIESISEHQSKSYDQIFLEIDDVLEWLNYAIQEEVEYLPKVLSASEF